MAASKSGGHQIDLLQLPLGQLNSLSQQLDGEIDFFTSSMNQLKMAQSKFMESEESVCRVNAEALGKAILVPLTSSMYVPGEMSDVESVLVDIGTGYYVDMSPEKAKDYFVRKVEFITKQLDKIQGMLIEKHRTKQLVVEVLQAKCAQQLQQQAPSTSS